MELLAYELKAAIVFALFYIFFRLLLSKETFHAFNRFVILGSCLIALVVPICEIKVHNPIIATSFDTLPALNIFSEQATLNASTNPENPLMSFENIALLIYALGALAVLVGTAVSIGQILQLIKNGEKICRDNNIIIICKEKIVPMSWMNYTIISKDDYDSYNESILLHEQAHIRLRHSWDVLFAELFTAVQWFNPAAWMMRNDLRAIHEYEADEYVLNSGIDAKQYQLLLVKKAVGVRGNSVSNSLNHSTLKNRITMMLTKKSSMKSALKALYVIPLLGICLAANATDISSGSATATDTAATTISATAPTNVSSAANTEVYKDKTLLENVNTESVVEAVKQDDKVISFNEVEVRPSFNGDNSGNEFIKWVFTNIVYPKEAYEKAIQGVVQLTFIINTDGSVTDIKVVEGADPLLNAEAMRIVALSPKWEPGYVDGKPVKVEYSFPIIFQLR